MIVNLNEIKIIKEKYNKKIITAFTIQNSDDVKKYKLYKVLQIFIYLIVKGMKKVFLLNIH